MMFGRLLTRRQAHTTGSADETTTTADGAGHQPVDRRNMLRLGGMAAAGAAAAAVASAVNASPADAANGDYLVVGTYGNTSSAPTMLQYDTSPTFNPDYFGLACVDTLAPNGVFDATPAVAGYASHHNFLSGVQGVGTGNAKGVVGKSDNNAGVEGIGGSSIGVHGVSSGTGLSGTAVFGESNAGRGVWGNSVTDTGVHGESASGIGVHATSGVGTAIDAATVFPTATQPAVKARSAALAQPAVRALGANATAAALDVVGRATFVASHTTAPAVKATSGSVQPALQATGKAVPATVATGPVPVAGNAAALSVTGVASFSRSNVVTMTTASLAVAVPGGLTAQSHVLATMQTKLATTPQIVAVVPNPATGKITIYLSAAPTSPVVVAWFVFG